MPPTIAGWAIMVTSIGAVCALTAFCFYGLLTLPPRNRQNDPQPPLDLEAPKTP